MSSSGRRLVQLLVLSTACFALMPPSAYGQSLREQLLGAWTLVSLTRFVGDVEEPGMLGREAIGRIIFAPDGHMCFNAMRPNRSKFGSRDFQAGTPEEKTAAYDSYTGYCGRYEVNEQERSMVVRVELSSYPNWTGTTQKRFVEVAGNRLLNSPPILSEGRQIVAVAVWERAK
jgi:Lipocalin-like domain